MKQKGETALHKACANDQAAVVSFLIERKANVNVKTKDEARTPLHVAAIRGSIATLNALFESSELDIDVQDKAGDTPLVCLLCLCACDETTT